MLIYYILCFQWLSLKNKIKEESRCCTGKLDSVSLLILCIPFALLSLCEIRMGVEEGCQLRVGKCLEIWWLEPRGGTSAV